MKLYGSYVHVFSGHCYNYRYYLSTGMVVIIGATRGPVLIRFGDF